MIRYLTAGESHGKYLTVILEGIPAGLKLTEEDINFELQRRQRGYGRGSRMKLENDKVIITSGVRWGETIGSPVCLMIENKDYSNCVDIMSLDEKDKDEKKYITNPRPGHADLAGIIKFDRQDIRDILERASARETAVRVAAGAVCKKFLKELNIKIFSYVEKIGSVKVDLEDDFDIEKNYQKIENSSLRCPDKTVEQQMIKIIDDAKSIGDTVGGIFKLIVKNVCIGIGSYVQWDLRLDAILAKAIMSIQAVKGVEFGRGFEFADKFGSEVHDEIFYSEDKKKYFRKTNNAGGIEGGITNGEDIVISAVMKPVPTLQKSLRSVDIKTKKEVYAQTLRSDICAVVSCSIIAEAMVAIELSNALKDKFGSDSMKEIISRYKLM